MGSGRTYWIDRCLGVNEVPTALRGAGVTITLYKDLYPDDTRVADAIWIPEVTSRGWVILTKDKRIRHNPAEIDALRRANAIYVCLASGNLRADEQAECLLWHLKTIDGLVTTRSAPLLIAVTKKDVRWLDRGDWRVSKRKR